MDRDCQDEDCELHHCDGCGAHTLASGVSYCEWCEIEDDGERVLEARYLGTD